MFGHADGAPARRAHHEDAALRRFVQVNIVHAHAGAAHGAQFLRLIQQFRGNFCRATHNQRVRISDFRVQRVF